MIPIDLLLMSGGGNDVVGENDFERFIRSPYLPGYTTASDCIDQDRLKRKIEQVKLSCLELLDIRDHYSPGTLVVTHCYDYPYPSLQAAPESFSQCPGMMPIFWAGRSAGRGFGCCARKMEVAVGVGMGGGAGVCRLCQAT